MSSDLFLEGKKFISARRARELTGYTTDYVGQLCRAGKLKGQLVGRTWYVSEDELINHKNNNVKGPGRKSRVVVLEQKKVETFVPAIAPVINQASEISESFEIKNTEVKEEIKEVIEKIQIPEIVDEYKTRDAKIFKYISDTQELFPNLTKKIIEESIQPVAPVETYPTTVANLQVLNPIISPYSPHRVLHNKKQSSPKANNKAEFFEKTLAMAVAVFLILGITFAGNQSLLASFIENSKTITQKLKNHEFNLKDFALIFDDRNINTSNYAASSVEAGGTFFDQIKNGAHRVGGVFASLKNKVGSLFAKKENNTEIAVDTKTEVKETNAPATTTTTVGRAPATSTTSTQVPVSNQTSKPQTIVVTGTPQVIERIVSGVSKEDLDSKVQDLVNRINTLVLQTSGQYNSAPSFFPVASGAHAIDKLPAGIAIESPNITGGSISNSTVNGNISGNFTGNISSSSLSGTTTAGGIDITDGGCFAVNGVCIASGGGITGSGVAGEISFFDSVGSINSDSGFVFDDTTKNVGIGTSSPYSKLSVVGTITTSLLEATSTATSTFAGGLDVAYLNVTGTAATSTFARGINLAGGCFAINGTCLSTTGGSGTPGGSANQIQFNDFGTFNGSSAFTFSTSTNRLTVTSALFTFATTTNFLATGSSTLQNFTALQSTTTNSTSTTFFTGTASSTNLFATNATTSALTVTGTASTSRLFISNLADGCLNIASGLVGTTGSACGAGSFSYDAWTHPGAGQSATTSLIILSSGFISSASSTVNGGLTIAGNATATNATTTNFFTSSFTATNAVISSLLNTSNLLLSGSSTLQNFTFVNATGSSATTSNFFSGSLTATNGFINSLLTAANILATGSTTLQNFTGINSTTTNSTSTTFFATTASSTNLFATLLNVGNIFSTGLATVANLYSTGSTTVGNLTAGNATTTNATTTGALNVGTTLTVSGAATSTFTGGIDTARINVTSTSTLAGLVLTGGGLKIPTLNCTLFSNSGKLTTDSNGNVTCANDVSGSGGGSGEINWSYTANPFDVTYGLISVSTTTNQVVIGASATSSLQKLEVIGGTYISGNLGLGTTSPYAKLSVVGEAVAANFTATSTTAVSSFQQLLTNSSTTLQNFTFRNGTGTAATTTNFFSTTLTATNGFISSLLTAANFLATGSSTLQNFTGINSTTTNSTSTTFFTTTASSTNLFSTNATTSVLAITGTASTTNLVVSSAGGTIGCAQFSTTGLLSNTGVACGSGSGGANSKFATSTGPFTNAIYVNGGNNTLVGIGTSTPAWALTVASSTAPQLALSDGTLTSNHWTFRNIGGTLYIATGSPSTFATSTASAITINSSGYVGINNTNPAVSLDVPALKVTGAQNTSVASGYFLNPNSISTGGGEAVAGAFVVSAANASPIETQSNQQSHYALRLFSTSAAANNNIAIGFNGYNGGIAGNYAMSAAIGALFPNSDVQSANSELYFNTTNAERLRIDTTGDVGIGTTTPRWSLQVASATPYLAITDNDAGTNSKHWLLSNISGLFSIGTSSDALSATSSYFTLTGSSTTIAPALNVTSNATNTFSNGINLYGGCFSVNGTCISGSGVTASGSSGQVSYFNGASSLTGSNNFFYDAAYGTLGIGTSTPKWNLQIASSTAPQLALSDPSSLSNNHWTFRNAGGNLYLATSSSSTFATSTVAALTINSNGQLLGTQGAAASPTFSFVGDSDTGLYTGGSDNLRLGTLGLNRFEINSAGLVGIGYAPGGIDFSGSGLKAQVSIATTSSTRSTSGLLITASSSGASTFAYGGEIIVGRSTGSRLSLANGINVQVSGASSTAGIQSNVYGGNVNGEVTDLFGVRTGLSGGIATNAYGLYIESPLTQSANLYGIYQEGATENNYFAGKTGFGTTTPNWSLQVASNTPYFSITDTDAGTDSKHWLLSNISGVFRIGTSSDALNSTSTALSISAATTTIGTNLALTGVGTTTATNGFSISGGCFAIGTTCIATGGSSGGGTGAVQFAFGSSFAGDVNNFFWDDTNNTLGIGTSTPAWMLQISSSTAPQLALTDSNAGVNAKHWVFRSVGGNLYIGTSSDALTSTSTYLTINNLGFTGIGTTSPFAQISIQGNSPSTGAAPLALAAYGGNAGSTGVGGGFLFQGGTGFGSGAGGAFTLTGGTGGSSGAGGAISLTSGSPGGSTAASGVLTLGSGNVAGNGASGAVTLSSGTVGGSTAAGTVTVRGGNNTAQTGNGGAISIVSGDSFGSGATIALAGSTAAGTGGTIALTGGAGGTDGNGGSLTFTGGSGNGAGAGGAITLIAGAGGGTNVNGSNVNINGGAGGGTGSAGNVVIAATRGNVILATNSNGKVGVGTTTPNWSLQVASATPYVAITDNDATTDNRHWLLSNISGLFAIGTSSGALTATSSYFTLTGSSTTIAPALNVTSNATNTFSNGINLYGGCFSVNGICLPSNSISGSGSAGQVAFFNGASSLTGVNNFFYDTTYGTLGIGTTTPKWNLQIASSTAPQLTLSDPSSLSNNHWTFRNAGGNLYLATSSASTFATSTVAALTINSNGQLLGMQGSAGVPVFSFAGDSDTGIYNPAANNLALGTNGAERLKINGTGLVGINANPGILVGDVLGAAQFSVATTAIRSTSLAAGSFSTQLTGSATAYGISSAAQSGSVVGLVNAYGARLGAYDASTTIGVYAESGFAGSFGDASIDNAYAVYATVENNGNSKTLTNAYGIYVAASAGTNIANRYGMYQAGASDSNYFAGASGFGTTTPRWALQAASSTAPQLALSDGTLTSNHWTFRNAGGNLYLATSSASTFATSTVAALIINTSSGALTVNSGATSTINGGLTINSSGGRGLNIATTSVNENYWIYLQGNPFITATGTSMFFGINSGISTQDETEVLGTPSGHANTSFGFETLKSLTGTTLLGTGNSAFGTSALDELTTGGSNSAFGTNALGATTIGNNNSAFGGSGVLIGNTTGNFNTGFGSGVLFSNSTGGYNTGVGALALRLTTTGASSTAIGYQAGRTNTTGNWNTYVGFHAGYREETNGTLTGPTSGSGLTNANAFGTNAQVTRDNTLVLGGRGAFSVDTVLGTTSPWAKLSIMNTFASTTNLFDIATTTNAGGSATSSVFKISSEGVLTSSSTATSTFNRGLNITGGCFAISGTCLPTNGTTGTGANGQVTFWTGSNTLSGDNNFFYDSSYGTLGIGTTTPKWNLQIASSTAPQLALSDPSSLSNNHWTFRNAGGNLYLATSSASTFATSTVAALTINSNGQLLGAQGTTTAPTFSFAGDTDTGIYNSSADNLTFATNGFERFKITNRGQFVLGPSAILTNNIFFSAASTSFTTSGTKVGYNLAYTVSGPTSGITSGIEIAATNSGGSGTNEVKGIHSVATDGFTTTGGDFEAKKVTDTDTKTIFYGVRARVSDTSSGGGITTAYGLHSQLTASGGRVITNGYGLYIDTSTGVTNPYGIYQVSASDRNYFAANSGFGTSTPAWAIQIASSTAPQLALSDGSLTSNHWTFRNAGGNLYVATGSPSTFATSTAAAFSITSTSGGYATTSVNTSLTVNGGAIEYDASTGITSIDALNIGSFGFDTDAGLVSWTDLPVSTTTANISMGYSAQLDSYPVLTISGLTDGSGGVKNINITTGTTSNVGFGTSTPNWSLQVASATPYVAITDNDATTNNRHWLLSNISGLFSIGTSSGALTATSSYFTLTGSSTTIAPALNVTSNATNTFSNGINLYGGCFAVNGTCLPTNGASASGAAGQVSFFTGASSLSGNNNFFWDNTGNELGIGTTTPMWSLQIATSTRPQLALSDPSSLSNNHWTFRNAGGNLYIATGSPTTFATSTFTSLSINTNGFVGVGSTSPQQQFSVNGKSYFSDNVGIGTSSPNNRLSISHNDNLAVNSLSITNTNTGSTALVGIQLDDPSNPTANGNAGIQYLMTNFTTSGIINPNQLSIYSTGSNGMILHASVGPIKFATGNTERARFVNGNFGIGTTSPAWALTVSSSTRPQLALTDGSLTNAGYFMYATSSNLFVGTTSPSTYATSTNSTLSITGNGRYFNLGDAGNFQYDLDTGSTTIPTLITGNMTTDPNPGVFAAFDMPIDSTCVNGTPQGAKYGFVSYSSTSTLGIYGACNGNGQINDMLVGIGTSSPNFKLEIATASGTPQLALAPAGTGATSKWTFRATDAGYLYIATSTNNTTATSTSAAFSITQNGTTTVVGLNITGGATTTSTTGINLSAGCFAVNGTCLPTNGASASGAAGQVAFFNGASSLTGVNNFFYDTSYGTLGIGTTTPKWNLQIASSTAPQLALSDPSSLSNNHWTFRNAGGNLYLATSSASTFATSTLSALSILSGGRSGFVGIGTTSPGNALTVAYNDNNLQSGLVIDNDNSGSNAVSAISVQSQGGGRATSLYQTSSGLTSFSSLLGPNMGVLSTGASVTNGLSIWTGASGAPITFGIGSVSGEKMRLTTNGLGIGTTTPMWNLTISSSTRPQLALTDGSLTSAGYFFYSTSSNLFIGTTSPSTFATSTNSALSITGNGRYVNFGDAGNFQYDLDTGSTTIPTLITGNMTTDPNPGVFAAFDMPLTSSCGSGILQQAQYGFPSLNATTTVAIGGTCTGNSTVSDLLVGIGTSSPNFKLEIASASSSQLALSDYNGSNKWTFRSVGNFLYIATSTNTTTATSTFTALTISNNGFVGIGSTSPTQNFSVNGRSSFSDNVGIGTTTPAWLLQVSSSTAPQLVLTDPTAASGSKHFAFRSVGGNLYIDRASDAYATTSLPWLTILSNKTVGIGTSSPSVGSARSLVIAADNTIGTTFTGLTIDTNDNQFSSRLVISESGSANSAVRLGYLPSGVSPSGIQTASTGLLISGSSATGGLAVMTATAAPIKFAIAAATGERLRIDSTGFIGIGTTTPQWALQIASSTAPQLTLSDGSLTSSHWSFRNNGGTLFLSTSSPSTFSTSTNSILSITSAGKFNLGDSGAFVFDQDTGSTTIPTLITGSLTTDVNSGVLSGFDLPVDSTCTAGTPQGAQFGFVSNNATSTLGLYANCNGNGSINDFLVGIGTSSPNFRLEIAAASSSQLALSDYSGSNKWTFRSVGNFLYVATSTNNTTATSTFTPLTISNNGFVGIGTTSPWRSFSVNGTVSFANLTTNTGGVTAALCLDANNQVTQNTDNETCVTSSARYKQNIETMASSSALDLLSQLRPVTFEYTAATGTSHYGLIAEDVELVNPDLVSYDKDGLAQSVKYIEIIPLLIQSVQEMSARLLALESASTSANTGGSGFSIAAVINSLKDFGIFIGEGLVQIKNLAVNKLTVGSPSNPTGITLFDEETHSPYCVSVARGLVKTTSGECLDKSDDLIYQAPSETPAEEPVTPPQNTEGENSNQEGQTPTEEVAPEGSQDEGAQTPTEESGDDEGGVISANPSEGENSSAPVEP